MNPQTTIEEKAITYRDLNWFDQSPMHYKHHLEHGFPESKAMEFGTLFKKAVLDPAAFDQEYYMIPVCDKRTIAGKAATRDAEKANEGKTGIAMDMYESIMKMRENVYNHGKANKLLNCEHLKNFIWNDPDTLVTCKSRVSILKEKSWMADIITTTSANPKHFAYDLMKYNYHRKAAFQLDAAKQRVPYYVIVVEKQAPFAVNVLRLPSFLISKGRKEYKALLKHYAICELTNNWPGYECMGGDEIFKQALRLQVGLRAEV